VTDEVGNLVLEQLRLMRASMQKLEFDMADVKVRMSRNTGQVITSLGALNARMDRFDERLSRVNAGWIW
jgi:hypothetical protein